MIKLTVALPVYNSRHIVWLAMESLCRQKDIDFEWELIICEEQNSNTTGEEFFNNYLERLNKIGCLYIKYIPLKEWIPLAQKWRLMGKVCCKTSVVFVMQASDDYWHDRRLKRIYDCLKRGQYDWYMTKRVFMYHIFSEKVIYYDHDSKGISYRRIPAVGHACLTRHARRLPLSDKKRGVDMWFFRTIPHPRISIDTHQSWKKSCGTQGMNNISKKRGQFFENVKVPFFKTDVPINQILPSDIIVRLNEVKEYMLKQIQAQQELQLLERERIELETLNSIADIDEASPISFVYVWVKAPAVWNELIMSIRSIKKFYKGNYNVFVVGDNPELKGVTHVPATLINGFAYCRSMDIANKLKIICNTPEITNNFIFMYDDIILLKKVTLEQLKYTIAHDKVDNYDTYFRPGQGVMPSARWRTLFTQTMFQLQKRNLPMYNYETHLPRLLNKERLKYVIDRFDLNTQPYLFNSLYFNTFFSKPDIELRTNGKVKAGVYRPYDNPRSLERELDNKLFLNYDDRGLNNMLKKYILKIVNL